MSEKEINIANPTISTNLTLYFLNRQRYDRFHYTNLYSCVEAMLQLSDDDRWNETKRYLQEMFESPLKKYFEKKNRLKPSKVSLSRLEFIAFRDQHFSLRLSKIYYIDDNLDLEFGQILDVLEFFKRELHLILTQFLEFYNIPQEIHIPESMLNNMFVPQQTGFRNA